MPGANACEGITTADLGPPDAELMRDQHGAYLRTLESCGVSITLLDADERFPDGCFVEDTAVVTATCAVITRPGAPSRRGEEAAVEPVLAAHRELARIEAPGCMDGGDVVVAGERALIGLSARTNRQGAEQLAAVLEAHGIACRTVPVSVALHLKSHVNYLGGDKLLVSRAYAGCVELEGFDHLVLPDGEEYAANSIWLDHRVLMPAGFPRARALLERDGFDVVELDVSEFRKMDGGLTCLSIRF
ncbi:MAG: arginine deiminase family protein [Gammaproteobacteria bacterium]|nr:arginine deiminase family protein [Gammaproteobacteria bacterium]